MSLKMAPFDRSHTKKPAWKQPISASIRNLITQKGKLLKQYIHIKTLRYCFLTKNRNIVRNKTKQIDRFNQNEIAKDCKDNLKRFWKYVKAKTTRTNQ